MHIVDVFQAHPYILWSAAALFGLAVGSFLNVVILRLPAMMRADWEVQCREVLDIPAPDQPSERLGLVTPRSRCPQCGHQIRAWENIPVISYVLLRGRCSACSGKISLRYPVIEILTAVLSVLVAARFGATWATAFALLLTWALIALSVIDFDTQLLPDSITLPFLWLGLLLSLANLFTDPRSAILGAVAGYLSLWLVYQVFKRITGKEGMGYGDFKLFALFGAWLGWQSLLQIIILSSVVGAVVGIGLILIRGRDKNLPIPFGPYLAAAGWISLVWGSELHSLYEAYLRWAGVA